MGVQQSSENMTSMNDVILIDDEEEDSSKDPEPSAGTQRSDKMASNDSMDSDSLPDLDGDAPIPPKTQNTQAAQKIPGSWHLFWELIFQSYTDFNFEITITIKSLNAVIEMFILYFFSWRPRLS